MRIAYFVHDFVPGHGDANYVRELALRLRHAHDVHVFANRLPARAPEGITLHSVPAHRASAFGGILSFHAAASARLAALAARGLGFDVRHGQGHTVAQANVVTAHIHLRSWFAAQRRSGYAHTPKQRLFAAVFHPIEGRLYGDRRRHYIAVSDALGRDLRRAHGIPAERLHVVHHGVDRERFRPGEERRGDPVRALFVGDLRKGFHVLLEALTSVPGLHLDAVTRSDTGRARELVEGHGLGERVRFLPPTDRLEDVYAASDLFVLPSPYDTFALVVTEAMAAGLPVIVSRQAGASELLEHGTNGFVLERWSDASALATLLAPLTEDARLRARVGAAARAATKAMTWDAVAERTLAVYEAAVRR
ncbi:MAG: glycosyltransferase family 4 protein [Myxococcota bacterium]